MAAGLVEEVKAVEVMGVTVTVCSSGCSFGQVYRFLAGVTVAGVLKAAKGVPSLPSASRISVMFKYSQLGKKVWLRSQGCERM